MCVRLREHVSRKHWTALPTLLVLITSVYCDLLDRSCPAFPYVMRKYSLDFLVVIIQFTI